MSFPAKTEAQDKWGVGRERIVTARCTDDGTPGGAFNITADYSVTPGHFRAVTPPGVVWHLKTFVVYIAGAGVITANSYGPLTALANGLVMQLEDDAEIPIVPPFPLNLKTNGDFQATGWTQDIQDTGPGVNHITFRLDFATNIGTNLSLNPGERLAVRPADDFTGLASQVVTVAGYSLDMLT